MTEPTARGRARSAVGAVIGILLVVAIATARVVVAGELEIAASTRALESGDAHEAAVRARAAALWYAPGAPHVRVAYGRLMALGREAEARKLDDVALFSYRAVTTASTSTRWAITPHEGDANEARAAIARIEGRSGERPPGLVTEPKETIERAQLEALAVDLAPRPAFVAALAGSFLVLLSALVWVWARAFDETGRLDWGRARVATGVAVLGLAGYLLTWWAA